MLKVAIFALVAVGLLVIVQLVMAWRKELRMYQPKLKDSIVRTVYRLKRVWKKPMTEITALLIQQSLKTVSNEVICEVCIVEQNNQCEECCLKKKGKSHETAVV
jgi:hypothetical protein